MLHELESFDTVLPHLNPTTAKYMLNNHEKQENAYVYALYAPLLVPQITLTFENWEQPENNYSEDEDEEIEEIDPFRRGEVPIYTIKHFQSLPDFLKQRVRDEYTRMFEQSFTKESLKAWWDKSYLDNYFFSVLFQLDLKCPNFAKSLLELCSETEGTGKMKQYFEMLAVNLNLQMGVITEPNPSFVGQTNTITWLMHAVHSSEETLLKLADQFTVFDYEIEKKPLSSVRYTNYEKYQQAILAHKKAIVNQMRWGEKDKPLEGIEILLEVLLANDKKAVVEVLKTKIPAEKLQERAPTLTKPAFIMGRPEDDNYKTPEPSEHS